MNQKKLFRSIKNKKIAGVCSGFADFFNLDITIIRLTWILISCFSGTGIILYILCIIIIPIDTEEDQNNILNIDEIKNNDESDIVIDQNKEEEIIINDEKEKNIDIDEKLPSNDNNI